MWAIKVTILSIVLLQSGHSLPILEEYGAVVASEFPESVTEDGSYANFVPEAVITTPIEVDQGSSSTSQSLNDTTTNVNGTHGGIAMRNDPVRPGMSVVAYSVEIDPDMDNNVFEGRAIIQVLIDDANTREDPVVFHCEGLEINSVMFGLLSPINLRPAGFDTEDGVLEIFTDMEASQYYFVIEYEGNIASDGKGLYRGIYDNGDNSYLAMNLYPTHARRVFPCVDEPSHTAALSLTVHNNFAYNEVVSNAVNEGNADEAIFTPLITATHLWGLVGHNFQNIAVPIERLRLYGRQGLGNTQHFYAQIMIQSIYLALVDYTEKPYFEIDANAEDFLHVFAMPDITRDWKALSTIGIWEPHVLMNEVHAMKQQKTALAAIAEALAGQWFGYVVFPQNWRFSWIIKGLQLHVAYQLADEADAQLDMRSVFMADVAYQAMYEDGYSDVLPLLAPEDLFDEGQIRTHLNGVLKNKAPAIMNMLNLVLGDSEDHIRNTAVSLVNGRTLQSVNAMQFRDSIIDRWMENDGIIENVDEFLEPWLENSGYPVINVATSTSGNTIVITQERFSFTNVPDDVIYNVPLSFTTRFNPDFENVHPDRILDSQGISFGVNLLDPEEDWVIFNIQGNGYYRVNYDENLWERIIWALEDPEQREDIHPLNRALLVDDALNLARAGRLPYEIAFEVVLTMEHETHYAVWKAFVRNMDFLRKRLVALDEDWDDDIYMRMVRRSIVAVERDIGFDPEPLINEDPMISLTRGLVMEHACKSLYQPCVAAAIDWFWDGNDINDNIPHDLRPAVFCTMVREGDEEVRDLLLERYESENVHWERVVILEALACSQDQDFILSYLQETTSDTTLYGTEERSIIFKAVVESSADNADLAFRFLQSNLNAIRESYGGVEKIEEILMIISENVPDHDQTNNLVNWANTFQINDEDFADTARRAASHALENLVWVEARLEEVYEWINENDATSIQVSATLLIFGLAAAMFSR